MMTLATFAKRAYLALEAVCRPNTVEHCNSNTNGSFTMGNWNSFFGPHEIFLIVHENIYLGMFSYIIMKLYVERF